MTRRKVRVQDHLAGDGLAGDGLAGDGSGGAQGSRATVGVGGKSEVSSVMRAPGQMAVGSAAPRG